MSQAPPSAKVCVKCGEDCSKRQRTKDPQGRYICQECLTKVQAARAAAPPAPVAVDAAPEDEGIFALDDAAIAEAAAAAAKAAPPRSCANCGMLLATGAVICTRCGLNTSTGKILGTDKRAGAGKACMKCGYSLEGLNAPVCPECGTINMKEDRRKAQDRKDSKAIARNELIKPMACFGIATAISVAFLSMAAGIDASAALTGLFILYGASVPLGLLVYFVCGMMWIGFDAPWRYTFLRMAAAVAMSDTVLMVTGFGFGFYKVGLLIVVMGYAMHSLMDLELYDAIIVATIFTILQFAIVMTIVAQSM